ncbi:MAG TPA: tRNA (adenosine(37)-N6)-threonylcarbamoyltransferase complex ATPase subunit type 1 TsaE [Vicinamibacterales bacterium]|nr:tRNA (adenosine(37)-N6)-threonylcarbamoyltransferase complex ATPase subunit type 1 TsaE [Vicinamibacterales bacterium]
MKQLTTHSEAETAAEGRALGSTLSAGDVVLLYGDLGAGKTGFVRGLAEGLGVRPAEVSSPTFTLVHEYRGGRLTLFHVDLYRLNDPREVDDLGLDEITADGVLAIEWAEKLRSPRGDAIIVRLEHAGPDARTLTITQSRNHPITQSPNHPITQSPNPHSDR